MRLPSCVFYKNALKYIFLVRETASKGRAFSLWLSSHGRSNEKWHPSSSHEDKRTCCNDAAVRQKQSEEKVLKFRAKLDSLPTGFLLCSKKLPCWDQSTWVSDIINQIHSCMIEQTFIIPLPSHMDHCKIISLLPLILLSSLPHSMWLPECCFNVDVHLFTGLLIAFVGSFVCWNKIQRSYHGLGCHGLGESLWTHLSAPSSLWP